MVCACCRCLWELKWLLRMRRQDLWSWVRQRELTGTFEHMCSNAHVPLEQLSCSTRCLSSRQQPTAGSTLEYAAVAAAKSPLLNAAAAA